VPLVAGAGLLSVVALGQLAEHGLDASAGLHEPRGPGLGLRGLAARGREQVETASGEFGPQGRAPIAAIA
jgi:hypothetical protein